MLNILKFNDTKKNIVKIILDVIKIDIPVERAPASGSMTFIYNHRIVYLHFFSWN